MKRGGQPGWTRDRMLRVERKRSTKYMFRSWRLPRNRSARPVRCCASNRLNWPSAPARQSSPSDASRAHTVESGLRPASWQEFARFLEQAGAEFIPDGVRRRRTERRDAGALFEDLRAISLRSAARLQGRELLTDADLYDENGLPA